MRTKNLIHPGEILLKEFLIPMGISQNRLSLDIRVPAPRINAIVHGKRAITADTALRLGRYFKMAPQFWLNLQSQFDLGMAEAGMWEKVKNLIPEFVPSRAAAMSESGGEGTEKVDAAGQSEFDAGRMDFVDVTETSARRRIEKERRR